MAQTNHATVTVRQMVERLGVTLATAHNWRRGSTKREPLPVAVRRYGRAGRRVTIKEAALVAWLNKHRPELAERWQHG